MPEVELIIGGFSHRVVCEAGQEARVQAMGAEVAALVTRLAETNPGHSPTRLLMLAALQFADRADELERQRSHAIIHGQDQSQDRATAASAGVESSSVESGSGASGTLAVGDPNSDDGASDEMAANAKEASAKEASDPPASDPATANQATARAQDQILQATQLYLAEVFDEMAGRLEGMERDLAQVEPRLPADDEGVSAEPKADPPAT